MQILVPGIIIGIFSGGLIGWLIANAKATTLVQSEKESALLKINELEKEWVAYKATTMAQLQTAYDNLNERLSEVSALKDNNKEVLLDRNQLSDQLATASANLNAANQTILEKNQECKSLNEKLNAAS